MCAPAPAPPRPQCVMEDSEAASILLSVTPKFGPAAMPDRRDRTWSMDSFGARTRPCLPLSSHPLVPDLLVRVLADVCLRHPSPDALSDLCSREAERHQVSFNA